MNAYTAVITTNYYPRYTAILLIHAENKIDAQNEVNGFAQREKIDMNAASIRINTVVENLYAEGSGILFSNRIHIPVESEE